VPDRADEARLDVLRRNEAIESRSAARAALAAAHHESLAATAEAEQLSQVHASAAARHREAEAIHLAAAGMAKSLADRLDTWLADPHPEVARPRMRAVVAELLGTLSATITIGCEGRTRVRVSASDATAQAALDAEKLAGQGPAAEACSTGRPSAAADKELAERWPLFAPAAAVLGVRAVIAAPLGTPAARLGTICGYYPEPVAAAADIAGAGRIGAALTRVVLNSASIMGLAAVFGPEGDLIVVHQAAGMVSAQAGCSIGDAHDLLAARAYAEGAAVVQIAARVIDGETRFDPIPDQLSHALDRSASVSSGPG
jgi:hypothetical protein